MQTPDRRILSYSHSTPRHKQEDVSELLWERLTAGPPQENRQWVWGGGGGIRELDRPASSGSFHNIVDHLAEG